MIPPELVPGIDAALVNVVGPWSEAKLKVAAAAGVAGVQAEIVFPVSAEVRRCRLNR
jgi:hypothetical protein